MTTPPAPEEVSPPLAADAVPLSEAAEVSLQELPLERIAEDRGSSGWPAVLAAFGQRDYRLLWCGSLVSNIGSWMHNVAKSWVVYELSGHSKVWLGVDAFASGLPVVLTPLAGVLADRTDRRYLLAVTNLLAGFLAAVLAVLYFAGALEVWHIIVASLLSGILVSVMAPANQSMIPELVGHADVTNAVALNSLQFNASRVMGPALGGVVLAEIGAGWGFTFNAISFLAVVFAVWVMRTRPHVGDGKEHPLRSLKEGGRYIASRPDILVILVLVTICGVWGSPLVTMLPALSREVFGGGAKEYSWLLSGFGGGAMIGAFLLALRSKKGPTPWRAYVTLCGLGVMEVFMSFGLPLVVALGLIIASGALWVGTMARLNTAVLSSTPRHLRGRVSSFFVMSFLGGIPVGSLLAGALGERIGIRSVFLWFGVILLLGTFATLTIARGRRIVFQAAGAGAEVKVGA
ncbi:MAG: MFS transporter [Phycisphaeraceae bacterium]|nr:MFS transporter [Phycisphaeraceae bacterium]